jgi:group I intron endonuclease
MAKSGIYKIINNINAKIYVGSSVDLSKRKSGHFIALANKCHNNRKLQYSFNKYGKENFTFEVIEYVENRDFLIKREQFYLDTLKPFFNIRIIADSPKGLKATEETKYKMSMSHKARYLRDGCKLTGRKTSEEKKAKMRIAQQSRYLRDGRSKKFGVKISEETKQRISSGLLKYQKSIPKKVKAPKVLKGRKKSPENRIKISMGLKEAYKRGDRKMTGRNWDENGRLLKKDGTPSTKVFVPQRGEVNGRAKLTWDKVREMRKIKATTNISYGKIAKIDLISLSVVPLR